MVGTESCQLRSRHGSPPPPRRDMGGGWASSPGLIAVHQRQQLYAQAAMGRGSAAQVARRAVQRPMADSSAVSKVFDAVSPRQALARAARTTGPAAPTEDAAPVQGWRLLQSRAQSRRSRHLERLWPYPQCSKLLQSLIRPRERRRRLSRRRLRSAEQPGAQLFSTSRTPPTRRYWKLQSHRAAYRA